VRIVVSTDAHSTSALDYATLGIGQARRAWLTKAQVVNTQPWSKVKAKK
jgi:DNA polymerase (family 10)